MLYRYHAWMAEASLVGPYRPAQTVRDSTSSYKIDYVIMIKTFLKTKEHQNLISGPKVAAIFLKG